MTPIPTMSCHSVGNDPEKGHDALGTVYKCPNIYRVEWETDSFNTILATLYDDVTQGCAHSSLESVLVDYVTSIVEPIGWKAVWRSSRKSTVLDEEFDFIVEVVDVALERLEAEVFLNSVIVYPRSSSVDFTKLKVEDVKHNSITVPLTELYVISEGDDPEYFEKTAIAIEHVRFFLNNISRPWDHEEDMVYTEEILKSRLQLFFDMKNNVLPASMIYKTRAILREAKRVQEELDSLYNDLNFSDSESEMNEDELMQSISLKKRLIKLQAKMEMLENPVIRSFVMKKYVPTKSSRKKQKTCPVSYVVAKQFTSGMIANLPLDSASVLEFEHNAEAAFKFSSGGDKIYLFPGVYQCDSLGWIEGNITVEGVGSSSEIILEATGNSEVFLNCCAQHIEMQNVTLRAKKGLLSALVVHHGELRLKNCLIDANEAAIGLLLLAGSQATLEDSVISNAVDGVQMRSLSFLEMKRSKITLSERHGVQLDAENEFSSASFTRLSIEGSDISNNGDHGIFLNNVPIADISLQPQTGDFAILKLFPWIRYEITDSTFDQNGGSTVAISSSVTKPAPPFDAEPKPTSPPREEMNYSALSDLLNEVNMSIEKQNLTLFNDHSP